VFGSRSSGATDVFGSQSSGVTCVFVSRSSGVTRVFVSQCSGVTYVFGQWSSGISPKRLRIAVIDYNVRIYLTVQRVYDLYEPMAHGCQCLVFRS